MDLRWLHPVKGIPAHSFVSRPSKPKFVSASYSRPGVSSLYDLLEIFALLRSVQNQRQS
jgi:hypothetical protein